MKNLEESNKLQLQFGKENGLIPVAVQDFRQGTILMVAYVNQEALEHTIRTGLATFWSRSREELWVKGLTSGNTLKIEEILVDCDQDSLVYRVIPTAGGACHTKNRSGEFRESCFYRQINTTDFRLNHLTD